jgi:hypothetical protein
MHKSVPRCHPLALKLFHYKDGSKKCVWHAVMCVTEMLCPCGFFFVLSVVNAVLELFMHSFFLRNPIQTFRKFAFHTSLNKTPNLLERILNLKEICFYSEWLCTSSLLYVDNPKEFSKCRFSISSVILMSIQSRSMTSVLKLPLVE